MKSDNGNHVTWFFPCDV